MALINPYGYSIVDPTSAWTDVGNVFETAIDAVPRTEAQQKDFVAAGKSNTIQFVLEETRQIFTGSKSIPGPFTVGAGNPTLALDGASPSILFGNATGSIEHRYRKAPTGSSTIWFTSGVTIQDGDKDILHTSAEALRIRSRDAGVWETAVDITDADTIDFPGSAGAPVLTLGDGSTNATPILILDKGTSGSGVLRFRTASASDKRIIHDTSEHLLIQDWDGVSAWDTAIDITDADAIDFPGSAGAPRVRIGDGTGNPDFDINKAAGGEGDIVFRDNGTNRWIIRVDASENFEIKRYNSGGVFQSDVLSFDPSTGDATFVHDLTLDNNTGNIKQDLISDGAGNSKLRFLKDDASASAGDFQIQHTGGEVWRIEHHDGVAFNPAIAITNANTIDFPGSNGDPILTIGDGTGKPQLFLDKLDSDTADIQYRVAGVVRFNVQLDGGENLAIKRYDSGGVLQDTSLSIDDATGEVTVANQLQVDGAAIFSSSNTLNNSGTVALSIGPLAGATAPSLNLRKTDAAGVCDVVWGVGTQRRTTARLNASEDFNILTWSALNVLLSTTTVENATGKWTFPNDIELDSGSPGLSLGDGTTLGGSSTLSLRKEGTGTNTLNLFSGTVAGLGAFRFRHTTGEHLLVDRHNGTTWDTALDFTDADTLDFPMPNVDITLGDGTGNPKIHIDKVSAGTETFLELLVAGSNRWKIDFDSSGDLDFVSNVESVLHLKRTGSIATFGGPIVMGSGGPQLTSGAGSPENVVTAVIGSIYMRTDGGAGTSMYVKESGTGNTGWVAK